MPVTSTRSAPAARSENLALMFQEPLTVIVRLRENRDRVTNAESFRQQIKNTLAAAGQQALQSGYSSEFIRLATFAVVGFLDESILNSQNAVFTNWPRKPLQEELFGTHMAGEVFFQNLQALLSREDAMDLADVLELQYLCLLLGFRGRYNTGRAGELQAFIRQTAEKIRRIRGQSSELSPSWKPDFQAPKVAKHPWTRRLLVIALCCFGLLIASFVLFKISLYSGASSVHEVALRLR